MENEQIKPVGFHIACYEGVRQEEVREELERLAGGGTSGLIWGPDFDAIPICVGETTREVYEHLFSTELRYETKRHNVAIPGQSYDYSEWVHKSPPIIPETLKEKIEYVELASTVHASD